jgi:hypothetical protein
MNGLELSRDFWTECLAPLLAHEMPDVFGRMAAGLCGHGSECLGYDDELSRDHDWGAGVQVFLTASDFEAVGERVHSLLMSMPSTFRGHLVHRGKRPGRGSRAGVFTHTEWLRKYCGIEVDFTSMADWLLVHEHELCRATNGEIWHDPLGEVTAARRRLAYYPEPVWRKRVAATRHNLQAHGPYQMPRARDRGETVTAHLAGALFLKRALQLCYLLRRTYAPYYKWLHRGFLAQGWPQPLVADIGALAVGPLPERLPAIRRVLDTLRGELERAFPEVARCTDNTAFHGYIDIARTIDESVSEPSIRGINYMKLAGEIDA